MSRFLAIDDRRGPMLSLLFMAALWTCLVVALASWVLHERLGSLREQTLAAAEVRLSAARNTMSLVLGQLGALPADLAHRPSVQAFMADAHSPDTSRMSLDQLARLQADRGADAPTQEIERLLQHMVQDFGVPLVLLVDREGNLLADGVADTRVPSPLLAGSLRSRTYFSQAMANGWSTQFIVGRQTKVPGLILARRIESDGRVLGIAAVKQDADTLSRLLGSGDSSRLFVTDTNGVVMIGNRSEDLFGRLPTTGAPPSESMLDVYQSVPRALDWVWSQIQVGEQRVTQAEIGGLRYLAVSVPLGDQPLTVWSLSPLDRETTLTLGTITASTGLWLLGCTLLWTGLRRLRLLRSALQAQARFEAVFQHAPNGNILFDRKRGITHCNPATLALFGATDRAMLIGRVPWFPPLSPERQPDGQNSRDAVLGLMRSHMQSRQRVQSNEWRFCRLDGQTFDAEISVIALRWDGEPQFCAVIEDVTRRHQVEQAMQQARAAAEASSQTKSTFLANMSHELRTPMNAIIGMTHLALEDGLPERQHDYIEKAHGSARNLLQILNDILDVSKIESGHLELERIDFDLDQVISDTADLLGLKAEEKGLELLFSPGRDLPSQLIGDPTRLRQVLVNLGGNAIKFTDAGEVTLGMETQSQNMHMVELHGWVHDTGVGMSEEQLERAFQPFMQADSSTTRRFGGTGLGLAISRQLVEKMGGRLWAESHPGLGSTFHFTVQFGRGAVRRAAPRAWSAGELRGRRALLADDNAAALEVLGGMLEGLGITVDRVRSGGEALRAIDRMPHAYSWILLDWKMPEMDGVSCARRIIERDAHANACILLVTAFARDDALRAGSDLPLAGVLQKPVTPSSLCDSLMQARPNRAQAPTPAPAAGATDPRGRLAGARVLLVEDQPLNQQLASELLRRAGIEVALASDGREALRMLEAGPPFDGVLMDCQMPVMDGYTATQMLRQDPRWRSLPVIAMTASALAADRERALASGMNAHITKPLDVERMFATMAEWIVPQHAGPPPIEPEPDTRWSPLEAGSVIDTSDGLARCAGNADLYRRMLLGFREMHAVPLAPSAVPADSEEARRRVHNLKGLAGSIGAHELHAAAESLQEAFLRGDAADTATATERVAVALRDVLQEIDRMLPPAPAQRDPAETPS